MTANALPLRLKLAYTTEEEFLAKYGPSLARGGVFVATRSPKPVGTIIGFEFVLANAVPVLTGEGTVIASQPVVEAEPDRPAPRAGMTLRFTRLDAASRERIDRATALRDGLAGAAAPSAAPPEPSNGARPRRLSGEQRAAPFPVVSASGPDPVLGIDLGTTLCRAAVHVDGQLRQIPLEGRNLTLPSVVAFDDKGRLLIGTRAKAQLLVDPRSAIYGAKRLLGRRARASELRELTANLPYELCADAEGDAAVRIAGQVYSAAQLSGFLLTEIRNRASEALGRPIRRAILGVPAYFNDRQRQAVRHAGQLAGLEIERMICEPTAVALAYGFGKALTRKRLLIFDLGGGTLDVSLVEATGDDFEVIGAGGDNFLGGLDFDRRLSGWLDEELSRTHCDAQLDSLTRQRIRDAAEAAKITLSDSDAARVHVPWVGSRGSAPIDLDTRLERPRFDALVGDLVTRAVKITASVLKACDLPASSIDEVIAVGGQSQSPMVRQALEAMLGRPIRRDIDPNVAVATGAALVGRSIRDDDPTLFSLKLSEVLVSAIGVGLQGGGFWRVLDRGTHLPCEKTCALPIGPDAPLRLALYQGESERIEENEYLGALHATADQPGELGVVFAVSQDGVLSVSARGPDGAAAAISLATADAPESVRAALLAAAPLPENGPKPQGLLGGLRRMFNRT